MKKNILFLIVLSICIISTIIGLFMPVIDKEGKRFINNNKIAVIDIEGVISSTANKNFFIEENSSMAALSALKEAENDTSIKGVILKINSPGGTVGMSQRIYNEIIKIREKKPIISVMEDVAASGGYYIASATDRIVALPGTMTGSIGVIMSTTDMHNLLSNKLGINQNVIKSGKYKDIGSSTRAMTSEERKLLQDMVDDSYLQFKEAIINGRINRRDKYTAKKVELTRNNLNKYADGRIFTGKQAVKLGFVDSIGGIDEAEEMMKKILSTDNIQFVEYGNANSFLQSLGLNQQSNIYNNILPSSIKYAKKPLYLWE
jgi:protease-4